VSVASTEGRDAQTELSCTSPGAVAPAEILAFAEGMAPPHVIGHLARCPTCRREANAVAETERTLRARLDRLDCPGPQAIGEYELDLLSAAERTSLAAHLAACPRCADELRTLREFLADDGGSPILPIEGHPTARRPSR
jgi:hypothetical protein